MPRIARARKVNGLNPVTGLPDTMEFFVLSFIERSGVLFVPSNSHIRDAATGLAPDKVPSNGYCPTRIREGMPPDIGTRDVDVIQEGVIRIRIVAQATKHPLEWTAHEIFEAICPNNQLARAALAPVNPLDPYYTRLLEVGRRQSGSAVVRMIKPSGPSPLSKRYEPGRGVPMTSEGFQHAAQAEAAARAGKAENPVEGSGFMPGWKPAADGPVISPEQLNERFAPRAR